MKKFLSLMLTLALIITTLALPITASAADISLMQGNSGTAKITVSYVAKDGDGEVITAENPVRPSETVKVDVLVKADQAVTIHDYDISVYYDSSYLTFDKNTSIFDGEYNTADINNYVKLVKRDMTQNTALNLTTDEQVVATLAFKVSEDANITAIVKAGVGTTSNVDTAFTDSNLDSYSVDENNLTENGTEVNIVANEVAATVNNEAGFDGKTYYTSTGVTVKYTGTNVTSAKVYKKGEPETEIGDINATDGLLVSGEGEYVIRILAAGMNTPKEYTFSIVAKDINAQITSAITDKKALGYKANDTFEVPVSISGLQGAQAAMIKFDLAYPTDYLELTSVSGATKTGVAGSESITYGAEGQETGIADGVFATLTFTVKVPTENVLYGEKSIGFAKPDLALVTTQINPSATAVALANDTQKITVVADKFAPYTESDLKATWTNTGYSIGITPVNGAEVKYVLRTAGSADVEGTQDNLKALFEDATAVTATSAIPVADDKNDIYVVAKIGDVYQLVAKFTPDMTKIDTTAPSNVAVTNGDMTAWAESKTVNEADVVVTDAHNTSKGHVSQYKYGEMTEFADFTDGKLEISSSFNGKVTIRAYDEAGNYADVDITVIVDADDPVLSEINFGNVDTDGYKTAEFTVTDISPVTVKVYTVDSADATMESISGEGTTLTAAEGKYSHKVNQAGFYMFVATDSVNKTNFKVVNAEFTKLPAASALSVKVLDNESTELQANKFMTVADINKNYSTMNYDGSNGKFTYVEIAVAAAGEGYTNVIKVNGVESDQTVFNTVADYEVEITTKHTIDTTDTQTATYKFSIVAPNDMPSVNNDKKFNIVDYALIRKVVGTNENGVLPTAADNFKGGIFSGDVTGDLTMNAADYQAVIKSLLDGKVIETYDFPVLNR